MAKKTLTLQMKNLNNLRPHSNIYLTVEKNSHLFIRSLFFNYSNKDIIYSFGKMKTYLR